MASSDSDIRQFVQGLGRNGHGAGAPELVRAWPSRTSMLYRFRLGHGDSRNGGEDVLVKVLETADEAARLYREMSEAAEVLSEDPQGMPFAPLGVSEELRAVAMPFVSGRPLSEYVVGRRRVVRGPSTPSFPLSRKDSARDDRKEAAGRDEGTHGNRRGSPLADVGATRRDRLYAEGSSQGGPQMRDGNRSGPYEEGSDRSGPQALDGNRGRPHGESIEKDPLYADVRNRTYGYTEAGDPPRAAVGAEELVERAGRMLARYHERFGTGDAKNRFLAQQYFTVRLQRLGGGMDALAHNVRNVRLIPAARSYDGFHAEHVMVTDAGSLVVIDPPLRTQYELVHRDIGWFLCRLYVTFLQPRAMMRPIGRRMERLSEAFMRGYQQESGYELGAWDRAVVDAVQAYYYQKRIRAYGGARMVARALWPGLPIRLRYRALRQRVTGYLVEGEG